jgi:hypothetical protein
VSDSDTTRPAGKVQVLPQEENASSFLDLGIVGLGLTSRMAYLRIAGSSSLEAIRNLFVFHRFSTHREKC